MIDTIVDENVNRDIPEPRWLTFLYNFAKEIAEIVKEDNYDGDIVWSAKKIDEKTTCIKIYYKDVDNGDYSVYNMLLSKRYFGTDMIRLISIDNKEDICMQANARLVFAFLSYM